MSNNYEDFGFKNIVYTENMDKQSFDNCVFSRCDFSNIKILSCSFTDCTFTDCNFSMTDFTQTILNNVTFENSKILGVKFNYCHDFIFEVRFDNCILDYSSFEKRKMMKTIFRKSSLKGVDFGYTNLKQSKFIETDLTDTIFYNTNIQEADFSTAFNYVIDITQNKVQKARFSRTGLEGLLSNFNIVIV